jgi:hypothetical protein
MPRYRFSAFTQSNAWTHKSKLVFTLCDFALPSFSITNPKECSTWDFGCWRHSGSPSLWHKFRVETVMRPGGDLFNVVDRRPPARRRESRWRNRGRLRHRSPSGLPSEIGHRRKQTLKRNDYPAPWPVFFKRRSFMKLRRIKNLAAVTWLRVRIGIA